MAVAAAAALRVLAPMLLCAALAASMPAQSTGSEPQQLRAEDQEPLPLRRSKRVPLDGERCAPGVTYMDECNTCICSQDGIKAHASCTFKICPK